MKLRWAVECNDAGYKTEPELQYWEAEISQWVTVGYVEYKDWESGLYETDENADGR